MTISQETNIYISELKEEEDKEQATEPVLKKFIVSDITPEQLISIHQDNKRGICLYVDELMPWLKISTAIIAVQKNNFGYPCSVENLLYLTKVEVAPTF